MTAILLASNSTSPGQGYLDHLRNALQSHFLGRKRIAFIPYAIADLDGYAATAEQRFSEMGLHLTSVHRGRHPADDLAEADGIFVGGGNTFRLLDLVVRHGLVDAIRTRVAAGAPYLGTSAGSNLACPSIMTTNDMPIVEPPTFQALGLVTFQVNAHYVDRDPDVPHGGESREQRISEFHELHTVPVIGLREGSWLIIERRHVTLEGTQSARLFRPGHQPSEVPPGTVAEL